MEHLNQLLPGDWTSMDLLINADLQVSINPGGNFPVLSNVFWPTRCPLGVLELLASYGLFISILLHPSS